MRIERSREREREEKGGKTANLEVAVGDVFLMEVPHSLKQLEKVEFDPALLKSRGPKDLAGQLSSSDTIRHNKNIEK